MALRTTLFVSLALALAGGAARADKVDWSQYIDHDAKPTPSTPAPVAGDTAKPSKASKASRATKKVAAKPKAKVKAKAKARRRH
ncbi:MAG TPA: hypothetical protein VLT45_09415 [Kofleriaceae bacterium]|nr:hypothetical protein [Kofleriaceae bacterium]